MFANLSEKLSKALRDLRGLSKLTEENIAPALNEVRSALMSADVNFKVAKDFTEKVKTTCLGTAVVDSVSPGQMAVKVISDELTRLLGEGERPINPVRPLRVLLVGLQGSGKTTSAAKLAKHLVKKEGLRKPSLIAADLRRPAAIDQLETLAKQEGFDFRADRGAKNVAEMVGRLVHEAESSGSDVVIVDTAGRLQIDADLMEEIRQVREVLQPHEVFLVADAALGQQAVDVATQFHSTTPLTGIILTKLDGDARGGALLSVKHVTEVPIKFIGTGEHLDALEPFRPEGMASRILEMGDILEVARQAHRIIDEQEREKLEAKMASGQFTLQEFRDLLLKVAKPGLMQKMLGLLPGMGQINQLLAGQDTDREMRKMIGVIDSMTPAERRNPKLIDNNRRNRIAKGAGVAVSVVNELTRQFGVIAPLMQMSASQGLAGKMNMLQQMQNTMIQDPSMRGMKIKGDTGKRLSPKEKAKQKEDREKQLRKLKRKGK